MQQANVNFDWDRFGQLPVVGILRGAPGEVCRRVAEVYLAGGFSTLEITMNSPGVAETIRLLREEFPDLNIGAGTVCSPKDLEVAVGAGAQFVVTPILSEKVIRSCVDRGLPVFPGAYTPTEIYRAWVWGASAVKIFPATQLGPAYVRDVLSPLDEVKLLPTGGVTYDNMFEYLRAGAVGVGMGSGLFPNHLIASEDYAGLANHFDRVRSGYAALLETRGGRGVPSGE